MLSYILAVTVILGSFIFYMSAFFFPEVHRKGDFIWSGVGLFYALVLWFCAGRITGAVLLGQIASVALVGWLGWQTLQLRRETTPFPEQTKVSELEKLQSETSKIGGGLTSLFKRQPKPTLVIDRKKESPKVESAPPIATAVTPAEIVAPPIATTVTPTEIVAPPIASEALTSDGEVVKPEETPIQTPAIAPPEVKPPKAIAAKKSPSSAPSKQGWFAGLFKRQPKPTLVIDRKAKSSPKETAPSTPTAVTPAEIVAPPIAIEALTPDREVVEPSEAPIPEEAIVTTLEVMPSEVLATEIQPSEEAIATPEIPQEEVLETEIQPSEEAIAPVAEVSPQEIELPTLETTTEVENLPSAAALQGATAEDKARDKDEDFEEIEEGFEAEPEVPKIESKAPTAKIEPAKGKALTKPAAGGGLADKILAPVAGLFSAVQNRLGGLFSQNKKPKTQSDKIGKTPSVKTQPPAAAPDIEDTFEEEEFPLEMNAVVEGFKEGEAAIIQTAGKSESESLTDEKLIAEEVSTGESESLTDEEPIAEEGSTMNAKEIMEEPSDPEAIAEAISTPESSETKAEEEGAIAPFEITALVVEEVKISVEPSAENPEKAEITVSVEDVAIAVESISMSETRPVSEPETSTETASEESLPEVSSPNPSNAEMVEIAIELTPEVTEEMVQSAPIEEIAPEVDIAPAEASEEAIVESSLAVEPEPTKALEIEPLEAATPVEKEQESEEEGFAKLVRSNREDAAIVETAKKSAETKIPPEIDDSAKASEESV